jgi:hypothetical protein
MQKDGRTLAARAFVRSLNILLRFARLYGFQHSRTSSQFDIAWGELESALTLEGGRSLLLASASSQLLLDGTPLGDSPTERSFAKLLNTVGLASVTFFPDITPDELRTFVQQFPTGGGAAAELAEQIKKTIAGMKGIRVNEVCFVPADLSTTQLQIASQLTSQALEGNEQALRNWFDDPQKLLQMILASEGSGKGGLGSGAGPGNGSGSGSGAGVGSGAGSGSGPSVGAGLSSGAGSASESWSGTGSGIRFSSGAGAGSGSGTGSGSGSGSGSGAGEGAAVAVGAPVSGGSARSGGAESARPGPAFSTAYGRGRSSGSDLGDALADEKEVRGILQLLQQIANASRDSAESIRPTEFQSRISSVSLSTQFLFRRALAGLAAQAPDRQDDKPLLLKLAEHLAIRYALDRYERGEVRVNAVKEMLSRLSHEIEGLRALVASHEKKLTEAGIAVQPYAEQLDQQFWAMVPEEKKQSVLLSADAWCVPPRGVRAYVEELFNRKETITAQKILHRYSSCVKADNPDARRRAALGICELADLYTVGHEDEESLFVSVIRQTAEQLCTEQDPELQSLVNAAFVRLSEEATASRCYPAIRQTLESLEMIETQRPQIGHRLRPRVGLLNRMPDFVEDVLRLGHIPPGLVPLLLTITQAAMEFLVQRFSHSGFREDCDLLVALAGELAAGGLPSLREMFRMAQPVKAAETIGILSRLDFPFVEAELPEKLSCWPLPAQERALRQLVAAGAPDRWKLLIRMFDKFEALLQPLLVDEIGMNAGAEAEEWLISLATQSPSNSLTPYVQAKAIESLGRIKSKQAKTLLRDIAETRSVLRWQYPRELRVVALQALEKIDPGWVQNFLPQSGIDAAAFSLKVLERDPSSHCIRQRRYQRLRLNHTVHAVTTGLAENLSLKIQVLNLGGGVATTSRHLIPGSVVHLELRIGLRPARTIVLVRGSIGGATGFEIAEVSLDDRAKIRALLAKDGSSPPAASAKDRVRRRQAAIRPEPKAQPKDKEK